MRWIFTGVTGVMLLAAQAVHADASVTITGVTDYDFRGISQSDGDTAIQGSFDYSGEHFYASAWASTVDFKGEQTYSDGSTATFRADGNAELDLVAGFAGETEGGWRWDAGLTYYLYPGSDDDIGNPLDPDDDTADTPNYAELYVGGGYSFGEIATVDVKYWFSPDLYDSGDTASYAEFNPSISWPWDLTLNAHVGYSFGDYFSAVERAARDDDPAFPPGADADYIDTSIGLARSFGRFDFEVKYVRNFADGNYFDVDKGIFRNDERVILSVATTLPWSKDGE